MEKYRFRALLALMAIVFGGCGNNSQRKLAVRVDGNGYIADDSDQLVTLTHNSNRGAITKGTGEHLCRIVVYYNLNPTGSHVIRATKASTDAGACNDATARAFSQEEANLNNVGDGLTCGAADGFMLKWQYCTGKRLF